MSSRTLRSSNKSAQPDRDEKQSGEDVEDKAHKRTSSSTAKSHGTEKPARKRSRTAPNPAHEAEHHDHLTSPASDAQKGAEQTASKPNGTAGKTLQVEEVTGDLFDAPEGALLVHACNCEGQWGAGIAKAFRSKYSKAYEEYQSYCKDLKKPQDGLGKALLISPLKMADSEVSNTHYVGCLFTSAFKGKKKGSKEEILRATKSAMEDLLKTMFERQVDDDAVFEHVRMCKINSGLFAVPWAETKAVLQIVSLGWTELKSVTVVSPPE